MMTRRQDLQRPMSNLQGTHVVVTTGASPQPVESTRMMRGVAFLFTALLALLGTDCQRGDASETLYTRLLRSTALVLTDSGSGTAWLADHERKLLVTNFHVVAKVPGYGSHGIHDSVRIVFPVYWPDGKVVAERDYYSERRDQLVKDGRAVEARVVDADETVDLALLAVSSLPKNVTAVPLAKDSPSPGDRLHSIGNPGDSSSLWLYTEGAVKQVARNTWVSQATDKLLRHQARVVETQSPVNPGDSGGPVVNDRGELVGVTHGGLTNARLLCLAIDITEVRRYLSEVDWMTRVQTAADFRRRARHYYQSDWFRKEAFRSNRPGLALADLDEAIRRDPTNPDLYLDRSQVQAGFGLVETFISSFLSGVNPVNPLEGQLPSLGHFHASLDHKKAIARQSQAFLRALKDCNKAIELRPQYALAYERRARVYGEMWDIDSALADLHKALELDRDCVPAYATLAKYSCNRDPAKAITCLTEILRRQPRNAWALDKRATQFQYILDYNAALKDLDQAIQLDPQNPDYYWNRAFFHKNRGRFGEAASDLLHAASLRPEEPARWMQLAEFWVAGGERDKAIAAYTRSLEVSRKYYLDSVYRAKILVARGDLYAIKGDPDEARDDYRAALRDEGISAELVKKVKEKLAKLRRQ